MPAKSQSSNGGGNCGGQRRRRNDAAERAEQAWARIGRVPCCSPSPAPQPMKKLRAGSSHVDPPLRIGQSASPAVQSGTHAAPTTAASGRARPNALAAPPRRPFASPPNRPPSSATDAANTALLAVHATAAAVAAPIRVAGARGLASSQSGGRSSLARTRRRAGYLAAEADDRDGLGRVPVRRQRRGRSARRRRSHLQLTRQPPAFRRPVRSRSIHTSHDLPRPDSVQTVSRQRPDSVQTASRQQNRSV